MGDEWGADSAFVHPVFVLAEWRVAGIGPSQAIAVIGVGTASHHLSSLLHYEAIAGSARNHVELQITLTHRFELFGVLIAVLNTIAPAHAFGTAAIVGKKQNQRVIVLTGGL